jgi:uncharacterized membrane protein YccC
VNERKTLGGAEVEHCLVNLLFNRLPSFAIEALVISGNKKQMTKGRVEWAGWATLVHSARTAVVAVASLLIARVLRLPEVYWAPITSIVITQSSLGAALTVSGQRFIGTFLGALVGAIAGNFFGPDVLIFAACVFVLGLLCGVARVGPSAYRFSGIALAIVLLIPRTRPAWVIAFHRFAEVSVGIVVALLFAWVWPEREPTPPA